MLKPIEATVVARISIMASPARVFHYLSDLNCHYLWNPHLQSIKPLTTLKLGTTYQTTSWLLGVKVRGTNKVTSFAANRELELENMAGTLHYRVHYQLNREAGKTLLICTTHVSSDSKAFAFSVPVLKLLARRELQSDLQALKIAAEHQLS